MGIENGILQALLNCYLDVITTRVLLEDDGWLYKSSMTPASVLDVYTVVTFQNLNLLGNEVR